MMYEQTRYKSMKPGEVYRCPPGGQVVLVINNESPDSGTMFDMGSITFLVLEEGGNVNWANKTGMTVRESYKYWSCGSWTRVA